MSGFNSSFSRGNWSGASGIQIGYAGDYPEDKYDSFTSDPVHSQTVNPNQANQYRQPGSSIGDVPINIQADDDFVDHGMGTHGWILDNIDFPGSDDPTGVRTATPQLDSAKRYGPDAGHAQNVAQGFEPPGFGRNFYGNQFETQDLHAWNTDSTPPNTTRSDKLNARYDVSSWPVPFDSITVMPNRNIVQDTERIPMRRMKQDDRPVFRRVALPGANIKPTGSIWNPQTQSNEFLKIRNPIPASYSIPVDPSVSQDALSQSIMDADGATDVGGWQM